MTTMLLLIVFLSIFLIIVLLCKFIGGSMFHNEEEITTTTTTTTIEYAPQQPNQIVGTLIRKFSGKQPYVIDPVDFDMVWLNDKDDMYEDGGGKMWQLV